MDRPNIVFIMSEPIAANPDDTQLMRAAQVLVRGARCFVRRHLPPPRCPTHPRNHALGRRGLLRRVPLHPFSSSPEFGRPSWDRTYPVSWSDLYPD